MAASLAPTLADVAAGALARSPGKPALVEKARAVAADFEAVFLNTMFQQMFASVGNGPFSGGPAASVWRSFLTDEYAKSFVQAGGIGLADHVQRMLLAQQEMR